MILAPLARHYLTEINGHQVIEAMNIIHDRVLESHQPITPEQSQILTVLTATILSEIMMYDARIDIDYQDIMSIFAEKSGMHYQPPERNSIEERSFFRNIGTPALIQLEAMGGDVAFRIRQIDEMMSGKIKFTC